MIDCQGIQDLLAYFSSVRGGFPRPDYGYDFLCIQIYPAFDIKHDRTIVTFLQPSRIISVRKEQRTDFFLLDEGNLFLATADFYNTQNKVYVFAGNTFNLARDGSRPGVAMGFAVDVLRLDQGTMVRFGSDFDGVSDALEGNKVYDVGWGVNAGGSAGASSTNFSLPSRTRSARHQPHSGWSLPARAVSHQGQRRTPVAGGRAVLGL